MSTIPPQAVPWALYRSGGYDSGPAVVAVIGAIFIYCLKRMAEGFWSWLTKVEGEDNAMD
ncbi:MAG TPA: hypothetical protein VFG99_08080, partial [Chloroflexia bacterium]|nr:hypothetical protein [Chloroflexia bacterium]